MASARLKRAIKEAGARLGVDIRSAKHTERCILGRVMRELQPDVVLDVGANTGQYARLVRSTGYSGGIVSFEALASAHARLIESAQADARWVVAPCAAVAAEAGLVDMHVSADSVSSSVLMASDRLQQMAPRTTLVGSQRVRCQRLDSFSEVPATGSLFLKIDTQGYELQVLQGATALLPRVIGMQLELSLVPLYKQAPVLVDVVAYVRDIGFELYQLVPGFHDDKSGRLLQVDGFFVRSSAQAPDGPVSA